MENLKIGWAKREISIDAPVSLPGQMYMRISQSILDPLYTTVLCVDGGREPVFFCTVDMVTLNNGVIGQTRQKVAQMRPQIPVDNIIMGVTHTHAGVATNTTPETTPDGKLIYPGDQYREFFVRQCAEAICEAWDNRTEGGMAYGYGFAVAGHSRRVVYFDDVSLRTPNPVTPNGHCVMYGNTNDSQFSHYEGGADPFLNAMFTFDKDRKLTGMVVNIPCPSQLSETFLQQTSDYWHDVRAAVTKEFGPDVYVLPQCAAAGDLSPRTLHYKQAQARRMELKYGISYDPANVRAGTEGNYKKAIAERKDIAQRILESIRDIYSWAQKDIQTQVPVRHIRLDMHLSRREITQQERQWCVENIEKMKQAVPDPAACTPEEYRIAYSRYESVKGRNERAIQRCDLQQEDPTIPMEAHVVQVGDIAFATNRFELYMDFMHRLQARSPFIQTFVIQLAGDEGGTYLATARSAANKGYGASLFCNHVGAKGGQEWVENCLEALHELKAQS